MPLGDAWTGVCRGTTSGDWMPDSETVRQSCNFGYAREKCGHVPPGAADAVRFGISHDRDGLVRIYWVMEKDHLPVAHGPMDYSRGEAAFTSAHADACIAQQAQAYVAAYLRRKGNVRFT